MSERVGEVLGQGEDTDGGEGGSDFIPVEFEVTVGQLLRMFRKWPEMEQPALSFCILRER